MDYIQLALKNTLAFGDTDIFPPAYEYDFLKNREDLLRKVLAKTNGNYENSNYCSLAIEVQKKNGDSRIAMLIDPLLHLDYLALAIEIAENTEYKRLAKDRNIVHSYRYAAEPNNGKLFDTNYGFHSFRKCIDAKTRVFNGWVISIDIREFYPSINLEVLEKVLIKNGVKQTNIVKLKNVIRAINNGHITGLPIGGNASRILAEVVLNEIDHSLIFEEIEFIRFVDDFVIFAPKGNEIKIIDLINEKLHEIGLCINYHKLKISERRFLRVESEFFKNIPLYNDETDTFDSVQLEQVLQGQIERIKKDHYLNCGLLKFISDEVSINRFAWLIADILGFLHKGFGVYILWVINNIDHINDDVFNKVYSAVFNLIDKKHSVTGSQINLAFSVRLLGLIRTPQAETLLNEIYQRHIHSPIVRLSIIQVFARWENADWLKDNVTHTNNLWEQRAMFMGLKNSAMPEIQKAPLDRILWS